MIRPPPGSSGSRFRKLRHLQLVARNDGVELVGHQRHHVGARSLAKLLRLPVALLLLRLPVLRLLPILLLRLPVRLLRLLAELLLRLLAAVLRLLPVALLLRGRTPLREEGINLIS